MFPILIRVPLPSHFIMSYTFNPKQLVLIHITSCHPATIGEFDKAIDIIDIAIEKDENAYIAKLFKIKLILQKSNNEKLLNDLDDLMNSLLKNNRFKILNNSAISNDVKNLFELDE